MRRNQASDAASPTLEDVAQRAGVSTATVSRCLNSPVQVSEATRMRVLEVVRQLGYAPNFGARALAAKRTDTFGAIIPTMENAIFARGLEAFQKELGLHGITMLVASSSYSPALEEEQIRTLVARGADALLLIGHDRTPDSYAFLKTQRIPHIVAWAHAPEQARLSIGFDNRRAMQGLAAEVLSLGHVRLGLITAQRAGNDRARARSEGVADAMRLGGLDPAELQLVETTYSIANGAQGFKTLMESASPPSAVFCGNDVLAAGALSMARDLGIDVPGDVSVTGFDDIELAGIVTPALTTVHVPHRKMGRGAAQMLVALRNGQDPGSNVELGATIAWRASLGPPPAGPGIRSVR
ncbi:MAG: LacI family DNA-binding transcriptional regulator [Pseudomonadota bacterium]